MTCVNWGIYHFVQALYNSVIKYAGSFNAMIYDLHIYKHFKLTKESYGGSMTGITIEGKKKMRKSIQSITDKIKQERQYNNKIYYASDMEYLASEILSAMPDTTDDRNSCITPVVSIAKAMGFDTFQQDLLWFLSGCIGINKKYIKKFKTDHIIFTNRKVHPYQQRFVIAHELAHYLFDYDHTSEVYYNTYKKNSHSAEAEKRANAFAASLLMPKDAFLKEYNKARAKSNNPIFILDYLSDTFKAPRKSVLKRMYEVGCYA